MSHTDVLEEFPPTTPNILIGPNFIFVKLRTPVSIGKGLLTSALVLFCVLNFLKSRPASLPENNPKLEHQVKYTRHQVYKDFFTLNTTEDGIYPAHKC